jgi:hypothetical protein
MLRVAWLNRAEFEWNVHYLPILMPAERLKRRLRLPLFHHC